MRAPSGQLGLRLAVTAAAMSLCGCPDAVRADADGSGGAASSADGAGGATASASAASGGGGSAGNSGGAGGAESANRAMLWNGGCAFAEDGAAEKLDMGGGFAVELWYRPSDVGAGDDNQVLVFSGGTAAIYPGWSIETSGPDLGFCATQDGLPPECARISGLLQPNARYHIVASVKSGEASIYLRPVDMPLDHHVVGEVTVPAFPLPDPSARNEQRFGVGAQPTSGGFACEPQNQSLGEIDELRIWNHPLLPEDVDQGFYAPAACNDPTLVAYYRFDDRDSSPTIEDCSDNDIDLDLVGARGDGWSRVPSPFAEFFSE